MSSLSLSIIKTLTYSDHFNYPLNLTELHSRLVMFRSTKLTLKKTLLSLVKSGQVEHSSSYYYLPGRASLVSLRQQRAALARSKRKTLSHLISPLTRLPGVIGIYLTGALAVNNSPKEDDYDLLIVTPPDSLWITRIFTTLITTFSGLRRYPNNSSAPDKLCLNLWLTPRSFEVPANRRSLYTAYELIQTDPLYDPYHLYPKLLSSNAWIHPYLPNFPLPLPSSSPFPLTTSPLTRFLNQFAFWLQSQYMKNKISRELITYSSAYFHPLDPSKQILQKLKL